MPTMKKFIEKHSADPRWPFVVSLVLIGITVVIIIVLGLNSWGFFYLKNQLRTISNDLGQKINNLNNDLSATAEFSRGLAVRLDEIYNKSNEFEESISDIAGTVGTLEKLSKTDRELLQKYSRVYFLSDNYVPSRLKTIDNDYLRDSSKDLQFHALVLPHLEDMLDSAQDDEVQIRVASAYRSFGEQSTLKNGYLMTYGSGSNQFSADQGYSEHQLGTTVDLVSANGQGSLTIDFESTEAFKWLEANAYKYGFVLSYPKGNSYYQYEPWHWRFVGIKLATYLHRENINFADMDQRDIDKYLIKIFD